MCGLAGSPPQNATVRPWLDLGDHAPHEQDDLTRTAPENPTEEFRLGETRVSECRKPAGQRAREGSKAGASKCNFNVIFILEAGKNGPIGCYPTEARSANILQNQP